MRIRTRKLPNTSKRQRHTGFVLISVLLLILLVSAVAVTVAYNVNSERKISGSDQDGNLAYYGAEAGMEKMTSDLSQLYGSNFAPTPAQISNLGTAAYVPAVPGVTYSQGYSVQCVVAGATCATFTQAMSAGPYAGLQAEIIPITMSVTATRNTISNAQASMTRNVEVGLIPVFQFGVFSDRDLSFFPGPQMEFNGRVHTNGNLFVTANSTNPGIIFHAKVTAAQDIIITNLANTLATGKVNGTCYGPGTGCQAPAPPYEGPVFVPTAPNGCYNSITGALDTTSLTGSCQQLTFGSLQGGLGSAPEGAPWTNFSHGSNPGTNWMVLSSPDATPLKLPFTKNGVKEIEIIRQPQPGDSVATSESRLFNQAQIRVLLADTPADLPGGVLQSGDVWLDNVAPASPGGTVYKNGVVVANPGLGNPTYFANGSLTAGDTNWKFSPGNQHVTPAGTWPGVGGWLRVEVRTTTGLFKNVTQEWLTLGFARGTTEPTRAGPNSIHPDAILILQRLSTRAGFPLHPSAQNPNQPQASDVVGSAAQYNWYPINLYDAREGLFNDSAATSGNPTASQCPVAGVMNVVELDVRNLKRWLLRQLPADGAGNLLTTITDSNGNSINTATGNQVENTSQNGYILYFSDRRGMLANPANGLKQGDWGYPQRGLDINEDKVIETYGGANIGKNFNAANIPTALINCTNVGKIYPVSGARHAIRILDGGSGDLPAIYDAKGAYLQGGFTVASEQPVYVLGDYNASAADQFNVWPSAHVASAIIADSVTLLSNSWDDESNLNNPNNQLKASDTHYRVAIAAGVNVVFNRPAGAVQDYGTDGGVHNFLRYIENWGGVNFRYRGSMVTFYYSHYGTGVYKSSSVYTPPQRDYTFDTDFNNLANMPPGTPHLLNITNLAYHQVFTPH